MTSKSNIKMKDLLNQVLLVQKDTATGEVVQVISPTHFRVGVTNCDSALTVGGPIYSLCGGVTSILSGNLYISGSLTVAGGVAGVDSKDVKVSANDASAGFLITKIVAGANVTINELNDGGNETLEIVAADTTVPDDKDVKVSANDAVAAFLDTKIVAGPNITINENNDGGNETLEITASAAGGGDADWQDNGGNLFTTSSLNVDNTAEFIGPVTSSLGFSGSLTRLSNGNSYIVAGDNITITSQSNGPITISSTASGSGGGTTFDPPIYHGFASGSFSWTSTTWSDVTNVANIQDAITVGITRSGNQFTFVSAAYYNVHARFNALGIDNYIGFRLTGSTGVTLLQHTDYVNQLGQHVAELEGIFEITASGDWAALEYAQASGSVSTWQPLDPLDGENMRSVNISFNAVRIS